MKETDFIDQNKNKWSDLERELAREGDARPDQITNLYIDSIDDLSFARTNYPNRMVRAYLNGAVEVLSLKIQKSQRNYWRNIKQFWSEDLPFAMYEGRREFLISFLILAVSIAIGIFSSMHDESFARYILGDRYVEITLENIEKGDPMAIYKDSDMANMFFGITLNNILVSARTFILSLFFGFGTILIMIYNGIMLGVFQYFFIERGLFFESFLTIWQHGVIEISCIVLAGAAGLVLAKGFMFPGSYSRLDSFRINGRKSLMIMLGLMPLLVLSGAIESYVTRFTDVHWIIRLTSILLSLAFIIFYFVWYPRRVAKSKVGKDEPMVAAQPLDLTSFSTENIQSGVSIFWESVRVLLGSNPWLIRGILLLGGAISAIWWWFGLNNDGSMNPILSEVNLSMWYLDNHSNELLIGSNFLVLLSALLFAHWVVFRHLKNEIAEGLLNANWKQATLVSFALALILAAGMTYIQSVFVLVFLFPIIGLFFTSVFHSTHAGLSGWKLTIQLLKKGYGRLLVILGFFGFAMFLIAMVSEIVLGSLLITFLSNFVVPGGSEFLGGYLIPGLFAAVTLFVFVALIYISFHLSFFTLLELQSARVLNQRIDSAFPPSNDGDIVKASILGKSVFAK